MEETKMSKKINLERSMHYLWSLEDALDAADVMIRTAATHCGVDDYNALTRVSLDIVERHAYETVVLIEERLQCLKGTMRYQVLRSGIDCLKRKVDLIFYSPNMRPDYWDPNNRNQLHEISKNLESLIEYVRMLTGEFEKARALGALYVLFENLT